MAYNRLVLGSWSQADSPFFYQRGIMDEKDCKCTHSHFDHIGWKKDTSYALNNTACRIIRCECNGYDNGVTIATARWDDWYGD